jgi:integrase
MADQPRELTPKFVAGLKPDPAQIISVRDGHPKSAGLEVRVFPSGEKRWAMRYRFGSRQRRLTLGDVAVIELGGKGGARELARKALKQIANGVDPADERTRKREAETVAEFVEKYLDEYAEPRKRSWKNDRALLKAEVLPHWKHRAMRDITRRDVRELIKAVFDRPAPIHANRVRACLHTFFKFAVQQEIVDANPVRDVPKPSPEQVRARVLSPDEIRVFWQETETLPNPILTAMWKLRLLTAQRPQTEVAQMQWAEIDLEGGWWTIPTTKAKNKIAHRVPLIAEAVDLLRSIHPQQPKGTDFVFAGFTRDVLARGASHFSLADFQPRDLRKTARTRMAEDGVPEEWAEAVINHKKPGIVGVYNLYRYDAEKLKALQHWARRVDAIIHERPGAAVLPFALVGA